MIQKERNGSPQTYPEKYSQNRLLKKTIWALIVVHFYKAIYLKSECGGARKHRADRGTWFVRCFTLNVRLWARRALCCGTCRTRSRLGALDYRASWSRARWAFANLTGLRACRNTRGAFRHRGLKHILGHIWLWRAFRLQHIF